MEDLKKGLSGPGQKAARSSTAMMRDHLGAAVSSGGASPQGMVLVQGTVMACAARWNKNGRSTGTCTLLCRLKAGCFAV